MAFLDSLTAQIARSLAAVPQGEILSVHLLNFGCSDIIMAVKATGDRFYLPLGHGFEAVAPNQP